MSFQIAFAVPGALNTQTGGSFYDRRLVECLREQGHQVAVLTLPEGFPFPSAEAEAQALDALRSVPAGVPLIVDGLAFGALPTAALAGVEAEIVALVHHPLALETGLDPAEAERLLRQERENLRHARHVLVPSPHTKRVLASRYDVAEHRVTVLEPGIDRPEPVGRRVPLDPPLILSVGLLHPRKGHDVLIEALARVVDLPWQAVIAGTPWDAEHVAALRMRLDDPALARRVRLAGSVPAEERDALYRQASLFALATRYEGYGIVFNEALIHGLPILSCRTGAVPDTVPPGAGLLVPPDDPEALAVVLRQVLGDVGLRAAMAAAAERAGEALPSWWDVAGRAAQVLRRFQGKAA
ncbi:glycosyltransferase family 4 protein [Tabrizicola sp. M-4]|uniref:glycosyltransferase family 4 protein n=1 Tax=Tabrizicola sp. M-4 TaxID=3055847 RepID=UPI003DAA0BCC